MHDIELGSLADSNHSVGFLAGFLKLPAIDCHVKRVVKLGMTKENKVVNGYYCSRVGVLYADRKLARQAVKEVYLVGFDLFCDAKGAPQATHDAVRSFLRIDVLNLIAADYLTS